MVGIPPWDQSRETLRFSHRWGSSEELTDMELEAQD